MACQDFLCLLKGCHHQTDQMSQLSCILIDVTTDQELLALLPLIEALPLYPYLRIRYLFRRIWGIYFES